MLEEVYLAALAIPHLEPVGVGELLAEAAITHVGVAEFGGLCRPRECFDMLFVEIVHESAAVDADSCSHSNCVHSGDVLEDQSEGDKDNV